MSKLSEYIRVAKAAQYLGVSQTTLRKWADTGVIPCRTLPASGYRLFREADLKRFLRDVARPVNRVRKPR
jgi:excisionase family DNA binding protein